MKIRMSGDCWERFGHWPDGKAFKVWDIYANESPDGLSDRDQWRDAAVQKIQDCEAAGLPITRRLEWMIEDNWADIRVT